MCVCVCAHVCVCVLVYRAYRVSLVAQTVKNPPECRRPEFDTWVGKIPWRRAWQPAPVFLPGESHELRSLAGCSPWGCSELNMTEQLALLFTLCSFSLALHLLRFPCTHLTGAAKSLSRVRLFATPWTAAYQAPPSMRFSRQESWSGLPCPLPGDLPDSGIKFTSLTFPALAGRFFTTNARYILYFFDQNE